MSRPIRVHLVPSLFEPAELRGGVAVVIDVLRATSTMIYALAAGAECVIPCGEIDEARQVAAKAAPGATLLAGERQGLAIPGFDLGNSPDEFSSKIVHEQKIAMTTTNGTRALLRAAEARRVLIAALVNLGAVVETLAEESGPVHLVCAATNGKVTLEDVLCAGGIVRWLRMGGNDFDVSDDSAVLALNLYESCGPDYDRVCNLLHASLGGRNLVECGLSTDITACAEQDKFEIVPEFFCDSGEVRASKRAKS